MLSEKKLIIFEQTNNEALSSKIPTRSILNFTFVVSRSCVLGPSVVSIHKLYTLEDMCRDWICILKMPAFSLCVKSEYISVPDRCSSFN